MDENPELEALRAAYIALVAVLVESGALLMEDVRGSLDVAAAAFADRPDCAKAVTDLAHQLRGFENL